MKDTFEIFCIGSAMASAAPPSGPRSLADFHGPIVPGSAMELEAPPLGGESALQSDLGDYSLFNRIHRVTNCMSQLPSVFSCYPLSIVFGTNCILGYTHCDVGIL